MLLRYYSGRLVDLLRDYAGCDGFSVPDPGRGFEYLGEGEESEEKGEGDGVR